MPKYRSLIATHTHAHTDKHSNVILHILDILPTDHQRPLDLKAKTWSFCAIHFLSVRFVSFICSTFWETWLTSDKSSRFNKQGLKFCTRTRFIDKTKKSQWITTMFSTQSFHAVMLLCSSICLSYTGTLIRARNPCAIPLTLSCVSENRPEIQKKEVGSAFMSTLWLILVLLSKTIQCSLLPDHESSFL